MLNTYMSPSVLTLLAWTIWSRNAFSRSVFWAGTLQTTRVTSCLFRSALTADTSIWSAYRLELAILSATKSTKSLDFDAEEYHASMTVLAWTAARPTRNVSCPMFCKAGFVLNSSAVRARRQATASSSDLGLEHLDFLPSPIDATTTSQRLAPLEVEEVCRKAW